MLAQDYLTLRMIRLRAADEWAHKGIGLSLMFPKGGTGKYSSGGTSHRLGPGDVLVVDGASGGKLRAAETGEMVFWCFSLCFEHLFPLFAGNEISLLQSVTDGFKGAKLYPAASAVAKECHKLLGEVPPQFNLDHRSQLLRAVAAILTMEFKTAQTQRVGFVRAEEHMIQVFEKLSSNELLSLSVGELADRFSCSRRHLNRLFHQHFGFSVAALRMEMRLLKAVSLLRQPDAKVINVAEQCGFNHLGLFNTCFKRRFGASPGQWRKLTAEAESRQAGLMEATPSCPLKANGLCPWSGKPDLANPSMAESPKVRKGSPTRVFVSAKRRPEPGSEEPVATAQSVPENSEKRSPLRTQS